jgi:hypothetical protein
MRIQAFSKDSFPTLLSLAGAMRMREGWDGALVWHGLFAVWLAGRTQDRTFSPSLGDSRASSEHVLGR